jgi:hypothetical protein
LKNFVEGVVVVKVLATPLGPEVVKNEGAKDVERLPEVGETAGVVSVEAGRVVLAFDGGWEGRPHVRWRPFRAR